MAIVYIMYVAMIWTGCVPCREIFVQTGIAPASPSAEFNPLDTGVYRPGVTFMEVPSLPKGEFKISTKFITGKTVPSKPVPFIVTVQSSQVFNFEHY